MIDAIIARLEAEAMPPLVAVAGAESFAALSAGTAPKHASAFVLPFEDRGGGNERATGFVQEITSEVIVALFVRAHDDAKGARRAAAIQDLKAAAETALAGWTPDTCETPLELVAARGAPAGSGGYWLVQTWRTSRYLEA